MSIELSQDTREKLERLRPLVDRLFLDLDILTYYNLLGVTLRASEQAVQQAFYRRAALLHPDRYFNLDEEILKEQITAIYRRISEAYRILSDPRLRAGYDRLLKKGVNRLTDEKQLAEEEAISDEEQLSEQAKAYYDRGLELMKEHEFESALQYLQQAVNLAPGVESVKTKLQEARSLLKIWGGRGLEG